MDDYRQSDAYGHYFKDIGWTTLRLDSNLILVKSIPYIGSIIKIQRCSSSISLTELDKIAKKYHALFVAMSVNIKTDDVAYAEVEKNLAKNGYTNLNTFLSPTKSSYVNLMQREEDILSSFDEDIRKSIKRNVKKDIQFKSFSGIDNFYELLSEAGNRRNFFVQSSKEWINQWGGFGDEIKVIIAYSEGKILGGNMLIIRPPVAYGLFLPTTSAGREHKIAATLIWEGMKLAKQNGCTTFDFDGIYDSRFSTPKSWENLTSFKRKFKGQEVEYLHPKVKIFAWYLKPLVWLGLL